MRKRKWLYGGLLGLAIASLLLVILFHRADVAWKSRICGGELRTVNLSGANLDGLECSLQIFREADLSDASLRRTNLQGTDFSSAATSMEDADLRQANLTGALLRSTNAVRADFSGAILRDADLTAANLSGAKFLGADMQGAVLIDAELVAADLSQLKQPPQYLDGANLTDARLWNETEGTRFCNTTMPDGGISKQGCFLPSYELHQAAEMKSWEWMDQAIGNLFFEALRTPDTPNQFQNGLTSEQVRSLPCQSLKTLDQFWKQASGDRFGFSVQRQIWESSAVNRDYAKFADAIGWRRNGNWLKFKDLLPSDGSTSAEQLPQGLFPWHRWQVLEPTEAEPTRFRRVGFGDWMARLKTCGI